MCDYCGCKQVPAIRALMDEHAALLDGAALVRAQLRAHEHAAAAATMTELVRDLREHVHREERGLFTALREQGDFGDEVAALESEHVDLDASIIGLDPASPEYAQQLDALFHQLAAHIEREEIGVFPVSIVSLGSSGWDLVEQARTMSVSG